MTDRNADALDRILEQEPKPASDYMGLWHLIGCKGALGHRGSLKERIAIKLALWVAAALMRNVETRKMFCLAIATEMVRTIRWIGKPAPTSPPPDIDNFKGGVP